MRIIDQVGNTYGRLLVLERAEPQGRRAAWLCLCDCGRTKVVRDDWLKRGSVITCGTHRLAGMPLTAELLREHLDYDQNAGIFTSKVRSGSRQPGTVLQGCRKDNGYLVIGVCGKQYYAHRLAWLFVHGHWPVNQIDHIDGDRANNAIANLRDVAQQVNAQNIRRATASNVLGVLGVTPWHGGRFRASIGLHGKRYHLGLFGSEEEAYEAYVRKKRDLHEGCTL